MPETDIIEVPVMPTRVSSSSSRPRVVKFCEVCGDPLDDARKRVHDSCRDSTGDTSTVTTSTRKPNKNKRKSKAPTDAVTKGTISIAGKLLYLFTLLFAWNALRRMGVMDPTGDVADAMAMTDEEAELIGRPLARVLLRTERGRQVAPVLVENEDLIDAGFAVFDWYKRFNESLDRFRQEMLPSGQQTPPPIRIHERNRNGRNPNGNNGQAEADSGESTWDGTEPGYIPPSPFASAG